MAEGIYADAAKAYLRGGWHPIPVEGKGPPPKGATGADGVVTRANVKAWRKSRPASNVALRHDGTLAVDVDAYGDKSGAESLAALEAAVGEPLPPTCTSTARGRKSPSRQHIYRVPEGYVAHTVPAPGIEVCQRHHRYSVTAPSVHPDTGKRYRWYGPDGARLDAPPAVADLAELPTAWLEHLAAERPERVADATWEGIVRGSKEGEPSPAMGDVLTAALALDHVGHDAFRDASYRVLRLALEGHPGAEQTIEALTEAYVEYMAAKGKGQSKAHREAARMLDGGAQRAAAEPATRTYGGGTILPLPDVAPMGLDACHDVFRSWLGVDYDLAALDVNLAAAAVLRMPGDPVWALTLSGSGAAKTETVQALAGMGARIVSSVTASGLLSASGKRDRTDASTGGLLREVGESGLLVIKDMTTILSQDRTSRAEVLAALREVYDGRWSRTVGSDGGQVLEWSGRLVVVGAVTSAWDRAHEVISSMGDRFVIVRIDSSKGRVAAGRKALSNTGSEELMRAELSNAVAAVLAGADYDPIEPDDDEAATLLAAADIVTRARTAVEFDYRGNVVDAYAPEMPTRFAKQLGQVFRGAVALGMKRRRALALAIRCARDSMPPLRLEILEEVAANPGSLTRDVTKRTQKPRSTVDRQLQALHQLGLVVVDEVPGMGLPGRPDSVLWAYSLADGVDLAPLALTMKEN